MAKTVNLTLAINDAQPILQRAAEQAARFGAYLDHVTRHTMNVPGRQFGGRYSGAKDNWTDWHAETKAAYLRAKRTVETFGVEVESISAEEALTVWHNHVGGKVKRTVAGFNYITGSQPDYDNPIPYWRGEVASYAIEAAANRVVRAWRQKLEQTNESLAEAI